MTTAVCKAATILGMREELLNELLTLINTTSGAIRLDSAPTLSQEECALMMDALIDEYSRKV